MTRMITRMSRWMCRARSRVSVLQKTSPLGLVDIPRRAVTYHGNEQDDPGVLIPFPHDTFSMLNAYMHQISTNLFSTATTMCPHDRGLRIIL